jgi:hypothetical protein
MGKMHENIYFTEFSSKPSCVKIIDFSDIVQPLTFSIKFNDVNGMVLGVSAIFKWP